MATERDVLTMAFRMIGVVADDEPMTADQFSNGQMVASGVFAEVAAEAPFTWTLDDVPAISALALARLIAVDLAPSYAAQPPTRRGVAFVRFLATVRPDDRVDVADAEYF